MGFAIRSAIISGNDYGIPDKLAIINPFIPPLYFFVFSMIVIIYYYDWKYRKKS